jgi:Leucine-rich repeat (LRR) protein
MDGRGDEFGLARVRGGKWMAATPMILWALSTLGCSHEQSKDPDLALAEIKRLGGTAVREVRDDGRPLVKVDLSGTDAANADLAVLRQLDALDSLSLRRTRLTDAGMTHLAATGKLRSLDLDETRVSDIGLPNLAGLTSLRGLYLAGTDVTDAGLPHLHGMTKLWELSLRGTRISDAGLVHLGHLTNLRLLDLSDTKVTEAAVTKLRDDLPRAQIYFQPHAASSSPPTRLAVSAGGSTMTK